LGFLQHKKQFVREQALTLQGQHDSPTCTARTHSLALPTVSEGRGFSCHSCVTIYTVTCGARHLRLLHRLWPDPASGTQRVSHVGPGKSSKHSQPRAGPHTSKTRIGKETFFLRPPLDQKPESSEPRCRRQHLSSRLVTGATAQHSSLWFV